MVNKLTLNIDPDVVAGAKRRAGEMGTSVSRLVEAYLARLVAGQDSGPVPPVLARVRGCMRGTDVSDYERHIVEKYG